MADTPLILRTDDLFISPIPDVELERLGNKEFDAPDASDIQTEEKEEVLRKISLLSEKDPLSGDSIFFGGHMSDRSDINERKYLTSELCSAICDKMTEESSGNDPGMNGQSATDPLYGTRSGGFSCEPMQKNRSVCSASSGRRRGAESDLNS